MGLLDNDLSDPRTMAALQLAGGLLSPGSFGQGLQRGLKGYQDTLGAAQEMRPLLNSEWVILGQVEHLNGELG
jgi:hypothetical protein